MKKDVIIIGGGVVGLMTAYSLQKAGRSVTVIDEGDISDCTSFGNAGLLSAFDKTPLSNAEWTFSYFFYEVENYATY